MLFNSVVRRSFAVSATAVTDDDLHTNSSSGQVEGDTLVDTHGEYINAPRNVAKVMGVPFVDANHITHDLEQNLGRDGSKALHMIFAPGETLSLPKGRQDNTHYNIGGAITVANLLADAVAKQVPALAKYVRHYDITVAQNGSGRYFSLQQAVDAAPVGRKTTIMVGPGKWVRPTVPGGKKIKFVLRDGATWKK